MSRVSAIVLLAAFSLVAQTAFSQERQSTGVVAWKAISSIAAPEANQAAAVDGRFAYAIDNKVIAKYDRISGERVAVSTGSASHLNSGFFYDGKLYCAHSNYPRKPEQSEIKVLDPETM